MRIGIDVDGVLASFEEGYAKLIIQTSGRDLFPEPKPWYPHGDPPVWFWTQHFGYTAEEDRDCWTAIKSDPRFWQNLPELPGARTLRFWSPKEHEVYFITNRMGIRPKEQTERWLREHLLWSRPTVLVSAQKGLVCRALELDCYIDDNDKNVLDAARVRWVDSKNAVHATTTYCLTRDYNKGMPPADSDAPYRRVSSVEEFLKCESL